MKTVYISGPLHMAKDLDRLRQLYERIAIICGRCGCRAYVPHLHTDPVRHHALTSEEVYRRDLRALREADSIVAYIGLPSSGVGAELAIAITSRTHIIAFHRADERPSRFLLGMLRDARNCTIIEYEDDVELESALAKALAPLTSVNEWRDNRRKLLTHQ